MVLSDSALLVGTIATYNCNQGYVLAGDTTRTCKERGDRTIGTWNGTMPQCEGKNNSRGMSKTKINASECITVNRYSTKTHTVIIRCQPLTQPSNGRVSISTGTHGVSLGVGAIATYSCNTGYGLVGQASRTCVSGGGTTGAWSGSQPTCEGINNLVYVRKPFTKASNSTQTRTRPHRDTHLPLNKSPN